MGQFLGNVIDAPDSFTASMNRCKTSNFTVGWIQFALLMKADFSLITKILNPGNYKNME